MKNRYFSPEKPTIPKPEIKPPAQKLCHKCELCRQYHLPENMAAYAWKSSGIIQVSSLTKQCGLKWICRNCINTIQYDANLGILT